MEELKRRREALNMTRKELAETAGVSASTITRYEAEKREPRLKEFKKIAAALNCTVDELLREE